MRNLMFTLFCILALSYNCAKRNNPLDPGSSNYEGPFIESYKIKDNSIVEIYDIFNKYKWKQEFDAYVKKVEITDINNDGLNEVIIGTYGNGKDSGKLFMYKNNGDSLYTYNAKIDDPWNAARAENDYIGDFYIDNIFGTNDKFIIVISHDGKWFASRLFILDKDFRLHSNYWNPGGIGRLILFSDSKNKKNIIISGINNSLRTYFEYGEDNPQFISMIDPMNMSGEAPPGHGGEKNSKEKWYGFFIPPSVGISSIEFTDITDNGIKEIGVWTTNGWVFYLNEDGIPLVFGRGDNAGKRPAFLHAKCKNGKLEIVLIVEQEQ